MTYYHGGKSGLDVGDTLVPSDPHVEDGCPICVARAEGRTLRVWEFREWLSSVGTPRAKQALAMLADAHPMDPIDPPTPEESVYVTTDLGYARFYAARSKGDLYRVTPLGSVEQSDEDHFPTWKAVAAEVREVVERNVRLSRKDRRTLMRRWKKADRKAGRP